MKPDPNRDPEDALLQAMLDAGSSDAVLKRAAGDEGGMKATLQPTPGEMTACRELLDARIDDIRMDMAEHDVAPLAEGRFVEAFEGLKEGLGLTDDDLKHELEGDPEQAIQMWLALLVRMAGDEDVVSEGRPLTLEEAGLDPTKDLANADGAVVAGRDVRQKSGMKWWQR